MSFWKKEDLLVETRHPQKDRGARLTFLANQLEGRKVLDWVKECDINLMDKNLLGTCQVTEAEGKEERGDALAVR